MPKELSSEPSRRSKDVVVIVRPYCSPDPNSPKYEQYCQQKLMLYKPFQHHHDLLAGYEHYSTAYANFLQVGNIPPSLEDDIHRLEQQTQQSPQSNHTQEQNEEQPDQPPPRAIEEWMLLCQLSNELPTSTHSQDEVNWTQAAQRYPNLPEAPSFIARHRETAASQTFTHNSGPTSTLRQATPSLHNCTTLRVRKSTTTQDDNLWNSWYREVILD